MNFTMPSVGLGWILALVGLVLVIVLFVVEQALTKNTVLALFGLAFLSRLLP